MGNIFSKKKQESKDFEETLSKLHTDIQKVEERLTQLKLKQRKASFLWIIYSLIIWVICVLYLFYCIVQTESISIRDVLYPALLVLLLPFGIYHVRKLLVWWYEQRQTKEEAKLAKLRKRQKDEVEDIKKKTNFYKTQSLLEQYDEEVKRKKKENELQQQRKPATMPMRPNRQLMTPQPHLQSQPINRPMMQQQQQQQQPIFPPQVRSEPKWYDKLVDALVGDAGPETKYALICNHCFHHNGLVFKEEFDTIQYICPNCKQFNPPRKSKQVDIKKENETLKQEKDKIQEDKEKEEVLAKLKEKYLGEEENEATTIASRVRQRHQTTTTTTSNDTE
ncbi:uncharacterized protein BX663DRAFT_115258 [Cokeromyces recurvatus]|uniref:uncharacterized protein n=1 Tax=Cokeromyces recurvatus TaxID=90255 RepID=UPI00221ED1FA|nr:uncharacterized protein BX663DRAFT_115258 [Cokeromyces recurvatus]KAI7901191.1 hypothetical protein BX663DRAFT_115258 [Cokeromyces recurvatus]